MEKNNKFLNGDTLKVIELIDERIQPVRDDIKDLKDTVIPTITEHTGYIQENRADIEEIKEAPTKRLQVIFWIAIIILQIMALFKEQIISVVKLIGG